MTSALQNGLPASEKSRRASERIGNWAGGGRRAPPTRAQQANCGSGACGEGRSEPRGSGNSRGVPERAEGFRKEPRGGEGCRRVTPGGGGRGAFVPPSSAAAAGRWAVASPPTATSLGHEKKIQDYIGNQLKCPCGMAAAGVSAPFSSARGAAAAERRGRVTGFSI